MERFLFEKCAFGPQRSRMINSNLSALAAEFKMRAGELSGTRVTAGFDGFVDEIISVVQERKGLDQWTPMSDITSFGKWITAAAGRSSLREIIVHRADPGGCTVNMGDGLAALGIKLDAFATLGQPIHGAFADFAAKCHSCHSWGREPGRTLAFEFADGKLMFSAVTQLAEFDPAMLDKVLADGTYLRSCQQARLVALTDWTLYPHMTACWRKLQTEVYGKLKHRPFFYLDLVDPTSRSEADIRAMIEAIPAFEKSGVTVLGLNGNEANVLSRLLNLPEIHEAAEAVRDQAAGLRKKLGISQVVIHCMKVAACADEKGAVVVQGPYCAQPKKSTGAGDRFNAGYCSGLLLNLTPTECLLMGSACSGFFVRNARSASASELAQFVESWAKGQVD
jgi:hypothetical protein